MIAATQKNFKKYVTGGKVSFCELKTLWSDQK
jgi:hypothetical protein